MLASSRKFGMLGEPAVPIFVMAEDLHHRLAELNGVPTGYFQQSGRSAIGQTADSQQQVLRSHIMMTEPLSFE